MTAMAVSLCENYRFAVDPSTLPDGWKTLFSNANDNTNEGVIHQTEPWSSVQFHPEAAGGPMDTAFLFEGFINVSQAGPQAYRKPTAGLHTELRGGRDGWYAYPA